MLQGVSANYGGRDGLIIEGRTVSNDSEEDSTPDILVHIYLQDVVTQKIVGGSKNGRRSFFVKEGRKTEEGLSSCYGGRRRKNIEEVSEAIKRGDAIRGTKGNFSPVVSEGYGGLIRVRNGEAMCDEVGLHKRENFDVRKGV